MDTDQSQQPPLPDAPLPTEPGQPEPPLEEHPLSDEPAQDPQAPQQDPVEPGAKLPDVDADRPSGEDQPPVDVPRTGADAPEMLGAPAPQGDPTQRDPQEWLTGDDPATEAQKSYLDALAREAGEQIPAEGLTKAQASEHIDRLQGQTGRPPRQG